MSVFSKIRNFFDRHRNKFVVTGVVFTSVYLASRYAQYKVREWQERETKEFLNRTRKSQHFESTERTCNQTIISLSLTLNNTLNRIINTEEIVAELKNSPENRLELWEQLKTLLISRVCTLIYVNTLLVITLRIQLNLIGGYLFRDTKVITSDMQQNYLSMCHLLLENGLKNISTIITDKVIEIMNDVKLDKRLSLYDLEQIFWSIQVKLSENELDPIKNIKEYLIPNEVSDNESSTTPTSIYNNMIKETADLLESNEVCSIATSCTNRGFSHLLDKFSEYYSPPNTSNNTIMNMSMNTSSPSSSKDFVNTFLHPSQIQIPLAKLLPILSGLLSQNSFPESLTKYLINDHKLKTLGANIYEAFSH